MTIKASRKAINTLQNLIQTKGWSTVFLLNHHDILDLSGTRFGVRPSKGLAPMGSPQKLFAINTFELEAIERTSNCPILALLIFLYGQSSTWLVPSSTISNVKLPTRDAKPTSTVLKTRNCEKSCTSSGTCGCSKAPHSPPVSIVTMRE